MCYKNCFKYSDNCRIGWSLIDYCVLERKKKVSYDYFNSEDTREKEAKIKIIQLS
jgi:hypothetical protein